MNSGSSLQWFTTGNIENSTYFRDRKVTIFVGMGRTCTWYNVDSYFKKTVFGKKDGVGGGLFVKWIGSSVLIVLNLTGTSFKKEEEKIFNKYPSVQPLPMVSRATSSAPTNLLTSSAPNCLFLQLIMMFSHRWRFTNFHIF